MAVLAVASADFIRRGNKACPDRSGRSLRDRLPLERRLAFRRQLLVHLIQQVLDLSRVHVTAEFGPDGSRVDGCRTDAAPAMPPVEGNREENVGRLRAAVSDERIVSGPLEIGVVEVHIGEAMSGRRKVNQASAGANQRGNPVYQDKVAQVIGAELRLKSVHRVAKWSGH